MLEERFLQIAITEASGAQPVFKIGGDVGRCDQLQELDCEILDRKSVV